MEDSFVVLNSISKSFGENRALNNVNMQIPLGKATALLGENGAGKTTLMNILSGLYQPDSGQIIVNHKAVRFHSPKDALEHGIVAVHQHFQLIDNFTVYENIALGLGNQSTEVERRNSVKKAMDDYGLSVPLDTKIKKMQIGQQQKVEIIKAIIRKPKLLILDEPTTNLAPQEVDSLFSAIKKMVNEGLAVVFITHKIKEALSLADYISILRSGNSVGRFRREEVNEDVIVKLMMGEKQVEALVTTDKVKPGEINLIELKNVSLVDKKLGVLLKQISLNLREAEILGIAGVSGNGQKELVELLTGVRKPTSGSISILNEEEITTSINAQNAGLHYIPEDRLYDGILPSMTVAENIILGHHKKEPFAKGILINQKAIKEISKSAVQSYQIKTDDVDSPAWKLSGGNIQKLLLARSFLRQPKVLVAHNPTRGLDVRSSNFVLNSLVKLKENRSSVILVSEDLDELISVCDRIAVMSNGEVTGIFEREQFDRYEIGKRMLSHAGEEERKQ